MTFNGTTASVTRWSNSSIGATVPAGATTGSVLVTVDGLASNAVSFTVIVQASITNLSPSSGPVGTAVSISGNNFGSSQSGSTVTFNGTAATVGSWGNTNICVTVPNGATTGNGVVTVSGWPSNGVNFMVAPSITNISPAAAPVGAAVTITGSNFGATQSGSTVTFNGIAATAGSWSNTGIGVTVPVGTTTGSIVVTVGGLASNGVNFTLVIPPSISSVSPSAGVVGSSVTISGSSFGATQNSSTVTWRREVLILLEPASSPCPAGLFP